MALTDKGRRSPYSSPCLEAWSDFFPSTLPIGQADSTWAFVNVFFSLAVSGRFLL